MAPGSPEPEVSVERNTFTRVGTVLSDRSVSGGSGLFTQNEIE